MGPPLHRKRFGQRNESLGGTGSGSGCRQIVGQDDLSPDVAGVDGCVGAGGLVKRRGEVDGQLETIGGVEINELTQVFGAAFAPGRRTPYFSTAL